MTFSWSPGSQRPRRYATRMSGVPRKRSVYTTARPRSGAAPRPGRPRTIAIASANTSTSPSARNIIFRFTVNPAHTSGSERRALDGLKKAWRTLWSACTVRSFLFQVRELGEVEVEPLLLELGDRPVGPELLDRGVELRCQLRALWQDGTVLLVGDDLAAYGPVGARLGLLLRGDDRRVEDERLAAIDLHGSERRGRRLVDERLLRRVQLRLDVVEARRRGLGAGLQLLQVGEALRRGRRLGEQHALVRVEVRVREVDGFHALRGDRRLLERDVEPLHAGSEEARPGGVETGSAF